MKRKNTASNIPFPLVALFIFCIGLAGTMFLSQNKAPLNQYAAGNDVYVSSSGRDSNNGSQASPFKTIQKGADSASAGTTVHVAPGTYGAVTINKSGTAAAPITLTSDTKWGAKIVTSGGLRDFPLRNNGNYVHVIGFDVTSSTSWIGMLSYGQHNLFQGNHVHDLTGMACNGSPGGTGMGDDTSASNNSWIGNVVNNIGSYPTKCDFVHGIYPDGTGDIIANNIAYNNAGNGIYCNHGTGNMVVANNLSFANAEYGIGINGVSGANAFIVENNIIIGNGIAGIKVWSTVTGSQFLNNIFFNNPTNLILDGTGTQTNTITSDPQLVNYQANGSGDYHLKPGSPAIAAGVTANAPTIDFDGNARSSVIDIGPFIFGSGGGNTSPTPTVPGGVTPSISQTGGNIIFTTTTFLHGIGKAGDNLNTASGGNNAPVHTNRNATIILTNTTNNISSSAGSLTYNTTAGNFAGPIASNTPSGQYTIKIKTDGFLSKQVPGIISVTANGTVTLPAVYETAGDVNNDNQLDILDYNMIVSCFGSKMTSASCTAPITYASSGADINDDSAVNGADYNLFLRELSVQIGN